MKNILEKIKSFSIKKEKEAIKPALFNPYKSWAILFSIIFLTLILFFAANTYFFFAVKNQTLFESAEEAAVVSRKYNHDTLDEVMADFSNRNKNFQEIINNNSSIIDPSV